MKRYAYAVLLASALMAAPAMANDEFQHNNTDQTRYELMEYYDNHGNSERIERGYWNNGRSRVLALRRGEVADVQKALIDAGYNPGPIDGVLGSRTRGAIAKFQDHNNLNGNGRLTETTLKALEIELSSRERDYRYDRARNVRSPRHYN